MFKPGDVNLGDPDQLMEVGNPPYEYLAVLRREAPVHWNPAPDKAIGGSMPLTKGFWVLSRHADVDMASRNPEVFSSWLGGPVLYDNDLHVPRLSPYSLEGQRCGLMGKDHPEHTAYRKLVSVGFTPKNIAQLEPVIRSHAQRIVDRVRDAHDGEFVHTVAAELPMVILCEMLGVPPSDWPQLFDWGNSIAAVEDPDINMFFVTLSIAGHETTRNTTAHVIRLISEFPDQRAILLEDLGGRLPNTIEETLRFSPPVMQFRRTATNDIDLHGVHIKENDKVYLSYASANRDEAVFTEPDRFDILRPNAGKHLSFGSGPHFCLGARLARLQLRILLEAVLTARPQVHVSGPVSKLRSIWFNAITEMPVNYGAPEGVHR